MIGQRTAVANPTIIIRMMLAGIPYMKNSPLVNCLESYAMALGAAPTRRRKGIPAVTSYVYITTSGATPR